MSLASTDAAAINVDVAEAATTATVSNAEGTLVRVTKAAADSAVTVSLADSTGSTDTLALELDEDGVGALVDNMNINVADVEAVSIKVDDDVSVDLSGLSMTAAGKTMGLTQTGAKTLVISALGTDVTTIDASAQTAGGVVQTGRSTTGTVEYTGGAGADTFIMTNLGDTMVGGKGTDTLDVNYSAILGGINVNLASTTNQIVSANGSAISGSVTGFENVDLSGYTGSFGALIASGSNATAGTTASITGTGNVDQISGGSGVDTITGGAGADVLAGGGSGDDFVYNLSTEGADTITDFASTDRILLMGDDVAAGADTHIFDVGAAGVVLGDTDAGTTAGAKIALAAADYNEIAVSGTLVDNHVNVLTTAGGYASVTAALVAVAGSGTVSADDSAMILVFYNSADSEVQVHYVTEIGTAANNYADETAVELVGLSNVAAGDIAATFSAANFGILAI